MHNKNLPKGLENSRLKRGSHWLPLGGSIKKRSLEKMVGTVDNPQKIIYLGSLGDGEENDVICSPLGAP